MGIPLLTEDGAISIDFIQEKVMQKPEMIGI